MGQETIAEPLRGSGFNARPARKNEGDETLMGSRQQGGSSVLQSGERAGI
jgi:hypothetical protein